MKQQNGGYIIYDSYPTDIPISWAENHIHLDHIRGVGEKNSILESDYFIKEWELLTNIVLISGDGHTRIALDYRKKSAEPSIIYIDTESEQIITIAKTFEEFLNKLYNEEETDIEGFEDDDIEEYTLDDLDKHIKEANVEKILRSLMDVVQSDIDMDSLSKRLLQLSTHKDPQIRIEVGECVWNYLTNMLEDKFLDELINTFENDNDSDVKMMAELIVQKVNYSFENLIEEIELCGQAGFFFKGRTYIINAHSNSWHISDWQADLQTFNTLEDLFEQATLEGIPIKEKWSEVKAV